MAHLNRPLHKLGEDFSSSSILNLFPSVEINRGYYQTTIQYTTNIGGTISLHWTTFNGGREDFIVEFGKDVHSITVTTHTLNSYPTSNMFYGGYSMRIDQLMLLNLITKLIKLN